MCMQYIFSRVFNVLMLFFQVTSIDVEQQKVRLVNGEEVSYDKCLIATGGKPRLPPVFANAKLHVRSRIATFRNVRYFTFCTVCIL